MSLYRDTGIVLRVHKLGEADRIITLLTRRYGKVRAVAKGVRRTTSRFGARVEPFCHVDVQLHTGRTLDVITQVQTLDAFGVHIVDDYQRYTAACAVLETVDRLAAEDDRVHVLHRTEKAGLGAAYVAGFRWALERDYAAVVEMDADGSHAPEDLSRLLAMLGPDGADADVVIGSRYVAGGRVVNWTWQRRLLSRGANLYSKHALGVPVNDSTAGFRVYRREALAGMALEDVASQGYCFQVDLTLRAVEAGFTVVEVPINGPLPAEMSIWVDHDQRPVPPPRTPSEAAQAAGTAGAGVLLGSAVGTGLLYSGARWYVRRRRLAAWE